MANAEAVIFGNAQLNSAPFDPETPVDFPEDTVNYGGDWATPWENRGYTQEGINLSMSLDRDTIVVDQVLDPLFRPATGRDVTIATNLAEMNAENLRLGYGQGDVTTTAPGVGTRGFDEYALTATIVDQYNTWGLDVEQPSDGEPFRALIHKGLAQGGIEASFGNRAANAQIPIEIAALPDDSQTPTKILTIRDYVPATEA